MKQLKSVLSFGAGRTAPGLIEYLKRGGYRVAVADVDGEQASRVAARFDLPPNSGFQASTDSPDLVELVSRFDVVASMLPYELHAPLVAACVEAGVPVLTPSYPDAATEALGERAREKGVPVLVEMGLDPGIDHAQTIRMLGDVRERGGRVRGLRSFCGALPSPEAARTSPLRFKLGWSVHSIVSVATKGAAYRAGGEDVVVAPDAVFSEPWPVQVDGFEEPFEAFPNRDSVPYVAHYGLPTDLPDLVRGTLRYAGWSDFWRGLRQLGWPAREVPMGTKAVAAALADLLRPTRSLAEVLGSALDGEQRAWRNPVEQLEQLLEATEGLHYGPGEQDMSIMLLEVDYELPSGELRRSRSSLALYGEPERRPDPATPGDPGAIRAISRATGTAMGIGASLVLDGFLSTPGLARPVDPAFADRFCDALREEGIIFTETDQRLKP